MCMRISLGDSNRKKLGHVQPLPSTFGPNIQPKINYFQRFSRNTNPSSSVYVHTRSYTARRPKSPFYKYEECIRKSSPTRASFYLPKITAPAKPVSSSPPNRLFTRKAPLNPNVDKKNYKQVNKFEDLVMVCVDSGPFVKENNLICYKKKYLVNLTDSNWHLSSLENLTDTPLVKSEISKSSININIQPNKSTNDSILKQRRNSLHDKNNVSYAMIELNNDDMGNKSYSCKDLHKENAENNDLPASVSTKEPPLGTPDKSLLNDSDGKIGYGFSFESGDSQLNIELNPETAEQFIDLLIAEDKLLRKKIAEGDMDPKTIRKLERLTELRLKYAKFKEQQSFKNKEKDHITFIDVKKPENGKGSVEPAEVIVLSAIKPIPPAPPIINLPEKKKIRVNRRYVAKRDQTQGVRSLRDRAFLHELQKHPLVQT